MITNKTKKQVISHKEKYCKSFFSQTLGLMFSKKNNLIMEFKKERKISLHNFFVFYPIDVLILDQDKKIVEIKRDFKPFTLWTANSKGKYVVELGLKGDYEVSDKLILKPEY